MTDQAPTAAILLIGNEILSGTTQDANIAFIAKRLVQRGIRLSEVRIVPDIGARIVEAVNALRAAYTYVFTTGGIGPTHDDITAESIAKAFGLPFGVNEEARKILEDYYAPRGVELNVARLRMAKTPGGAKLIDNPVSAAPGFCVENVFVMAGVPKIMQAMFDHVDTMLKGGPIMLSTTVQCNQREGDIGQQLDDIQKEFPDLDIGSYPHMYQTPSLSLVLRGTDETRIATAAEKVRAMVRAAGDEPIG